MVAIVGLLIHYRYYWFFGVEANFLYASFHNAGLFFFYISLLLTIWSGADYLVKFFRVFAR
jgi:CDP-diacylglycerol--glycerol-3-phosphate 3-phosphatidyltransferase